MGVAFQEQRSRSNEGRKLANAGPREIAKKTISKHKRRKARKFKRIVALCIEVQSKLATAIRQYTTSLCLDACFELRVRVFRGILDENRAGKSPFHRNPSS